MAFQVSPGVNVTEVDLTTASPSIPTSEAAIAGPFKWGPVSERRLIETETQLVATYGKPTSYNAETFFTAANYLSYGNKLYVVRVADTANATANVFTTPTYEAANAAASQYIIAGDGNTVITSSLLDESNAASFSIDFSNNSVFDLNVGAYGLFEYVASNGTVVESNFRLVTAANSSTLTVDRPLTFTTNTATSNTGDFVQVRKYLSALTAVANVNTVDTITSQIVLNEDNYTSNTPTFDADVYYVAKYPGALGNSLKISVCDSANAFTKTISVSANATDISTNTSLTNISATVGDTFVTVTVTSSNSTALHANTRAVAVLGELTLGDYLELGNSSIGRQYVKIKSFNGANSTAAGNSTVFPVTSTNPADIIPVAINSTARSFKLNIESRFTLADSFTSGTITRYWEYFNNVDKAPGRSKFLNDLAAEGNTAASDELHIVVSDEDGAFSGVPGTVLEVYNSLSRVSTARTDDGSSNYYKDVINQTSKYVWWSNDRPGAASANASLVASSGNQKPLTLSFAAGKDGRDEFSIPVSTLSLGYDLFSNPEELDVSFILQGKARGGTNGEQLSNYIISNVCERRRDCVLFASPERDDVVNNTGQEVADMRVFRNSLISTSFAVLDSGYKYQYDKYNDVYRYVPLNGDIAGTAVRTDSQRDPWFSPAGFTRGIVKNIVKLSYNPNKADRDELYKSDINPVVTFPGQGTVLFGDKTLIGRSTPFDRINVRRLFIVLEKAIATAAKFAMFEFNDEFTRSQFRNLVEPLLRDVQGRKGIFDYRVVCDETNNTSEIIDANQFIGDIFIKPAKSINFVQLNFVAVRSGVEFTEIVGRATE